MQISNVAPPGLARSPEIIATAAAFSILLVHVHLNAFIEVARSKNDRLPDLDQTNPIRQVSNPQLSPHRLKIEFLAQCVPLDRTRSPVTSSSMGPPPPPYQTHNVSSAQTFQ